MRFYKKIKTNQSRHFFTKRIKKLPKHALENNKKNMTKKLFKFRVYMKEKFLHPPLKKYCTQEERNVY